MKRSRKRNDDGKTSTTTNASCPQNHRYYQKYSQQKDFDNDNDLKLSLGRTNKFVRPCRRRRSAIMAFYYLLAVFTYSAVLLLSNTIFLQVEVVTALAFKFPKPPSIMNNLINGRSNDGKSNAPVLQDWSLDEETYALIGTVTGHPAVPDGEIITTAPLEDDNIDVAIKLLSIEKNSRKFIPRRQSSKHTKSITTISGTTYSLLPPNMRIGDAGLLSRGKKQSSLSTTDFPYKQQLVYLEEQIEVVKVLAKREDELQEERKSQEIIRNTGIIAAMVIGASYAVGDGVNLDNIMNTFLDKIDDTTITTTTTTTPSTMNVGNTDDVKRGETTSMDAKNADDALESKMFAQQAKQAKVVLPYLEERIQSLEDQQKQQQEQEQEQEQSGNSNNDNNKAEIIKVEEEKSSAMNEVVDNEDDSSLKTESSSIVRDEVKESINTIPLSQESEPTTSMATIQDSVTKVLGDIKESLQQQTEEAQIEQKSELGENNEKESSPERVNKGIIDTLQSKEQQEKETDQKQSSGGATTENTVGNVLGSGTAVDSSQQQQLLQSKQREIFEEIKKITNDLNLIREDTTKEFEKVISDLAWAGKKVLEADAMKLDGGASDSNKSYLESASSAISVFGADGVALLYKYTTEAIKTVSDALSLDQNQAYVDSINRIWTELSSNISTENPQILEILKKDYNDYSDEEKTQLITAASVVAIAGVTAAVLRSQWSPNQEQDFETGDTDFQNSEEYFQEEYSNIPSYSDIDSDAEFTSFQPDFEQQQPEATATAFSTETYANDFNPNQFPFATSASTSTWSDPSSSEDDMFSNQIGGDNVYGTPDPLSNMSKSNIVGADFTTGQSLTAPYSQSMRGQFEPETEAQTQADVMNGSNMNDYGADVDSSQLNGVSGNDFGSFGVPITPTASKDFKDGAYEEQRMKDQEKTITKTSNSMNRSDANGVTRQTFPPIGIPSKKMKADQQETNDRPKQSFSPFGATPKSSSSSNSFGAPTSPLSQFKRSSSPFDRVTAPSSPTGSNNSYDTSPKTTDEQEGKVATTDVKQAASPFGAGFGAPPKNTNQVASPFGAGAGFGASQKTGAEPPKAGKQGASSFGSGFGAPPKQGFAMPPKTGKQAASPFGAGAAPKQGAEFQKFTAPGKQANSSFGGGFGGSVKTDAAPKKSFSPFGTTPKTSSQTLSSGSLGTDTPTSPLSTKTESSVNPKQSFSPFEKQERKVTTTDSKQAASPFGAGFGAPPKVGSNQVASPFGTGAGSGASQKTDAAGPPTGKQGASPFGSGFGAPPKQGLALPKTGKQGASPFGAAPKQGAAFPKFIAPGKQTNSPFGGGLGSSPGKQTSSPFGTGATPKQGATLPKIENQAASPFGAGSAPKQEAASDSTVFDTSEPNSSSFRSRPKIPSKPQEDMYERMLTEQAKRDEDREQKNKVEGNKGSPDGSNNGSSGPISDDKSSPSLADEGSIAALNQEGKSSRKSEEKSFAKESKETTDQVAEADARLEEKRKLAKEKAEIEEDRRLIAKERAQLEEDRTKQANKIEDERTEFSNEDQKEEYRMEEIKQLAREQAKFEMEARERGFTKEEKAKKEKTRMDRLQKLAREQAQFEYERKRTDVSSNEDKMQDRVSLKSQNGVSPFQSADTPSNEDKMQDRVRQSSTASKKEDILMGTKRRTQDRANAKPQNDVSLFQSAGTPSNEDKMQNRVRQSSTASKKEEDILIGIKRRTQDGANAKPQKDVSLFQSADTPSNEDKMQNRVRQSSTASKKEDILMGGKKTTQDRANAKQQKDVSLFQSADTPSNEDKMQNRVRQQSTVSKKEDVLIGTKKRTQDKTNTFNSNEDKMQDRANVKSQNDSTPFQSAGTPSNEDKMQDRVRQQNTASKKDDVLIGTKKKTQNRASTFQSARSTSKEEEMKGERARLDQLENLATNQARSKTDRTTSANDTRQSKNKKAIEKELYRKMLNEQIIDVEVFTLDDDKEKKITDGKEDTKQDQEEVRKEQLKEQQRKEKESQDEKKRKLEENARLRSHQQSLENENPRLENDNEKKMDTKSKNRLQLEAQARQRSKQQSLRNGTLHSEVNNETVGKGVSSKATTTTRSEVIEERTQKDDKPNRLQAEPRLQGRTVLNEKQKVVADAIMKSDGSYKPSVEALVDTSMLLKQVCGPSISNYKGSKELLHKKSNVSVYVGRAESIPVRVSTPGTFVEFSINKKASEFDFGILAVPDNGYAVDVKVNMLLLFEGKTR
jgi:hypothetical protein